MFARVKDSITQALTTLVLVSLLGGAALAAEQAQKPTSVAPPPMSASEQTGYTVKASDIVLPDDVPLGQYRRVTRPFPNWTLICDENLAKQQKVCNITQTILDNGGGSAFSWTLAAAQDGRPFFILRVPAIVGTKGAIRLELPDKGPMVSVPIKGCDARVCIAYQQIGPRLRTAVEKGGGVGISYDNGSPSNVISFSATLSGLNEALSGI